MRFRSSPSCRGRPRRCAPALFTSTSRWPSCDRHRHHALGPFVVERVDRDERARPLRRRRRRRARHRVDVRDLSIQRAARGCSATASPSPLATPLTNAQHAKYGVSIVSCPMETLSACLRRVNRLQRRSLRFLEGEMRSYVGRVPACRTAGASTRRLALRTADRRRCAARRIGGIDRHRRRRVAREHAPQPTGREVARADRFGQARHWPTPRSRATAGFVGKRGGWRSRPARRRRCSANGGSPICHRRCRRARQVGRLLGVFAAAASARAKLVGCGHQLPHHGLRTGVRSATGDPRS